MPEINHSNSRFKMASSTRSVSDEAATIGS